MKENKNEVEQLDQLIFDAIKQRVSDIHFDANEDGGRIRFRIDGVLKTIQGVERKVFKAFVDRLKAMSALNADEKRLPQDGRIQIKVDKRPVDLRICLMPTIYGENMTVRILDTSTLCLDINKIGLDEEQMAMLKRWQALNWGGIFFSGPVGSGKTTTMYCCINELNTESKKICTIEDPVEFVIPGIAQTSVNVRSGLTFATGLRAIHRTDPDAIMVGEVRDFDTMKLIFNSILTGHLVYTHFHTETATEALYRIVDMQIEPFIIKSGLRGIVSQRLVRRLCDHCKEKISLDEQYMQDFKLPQGQYYTAKGCDKCNDTGFKFRVPAYEFFELSDATTQLLLNKSSEKEIRKQAIKEGMKTLWGDGVEKALQGLTSVDELVRVIGGPM